MRLIVKVALSVGFFLATSQLAVSAATITFDDLALNEAIGYHYAAAGVEFAINVGIGPFATDIAPPIPHSGAHVAELVEAEFGTLPISFGFTAGQSHVSFYGCTSTANATGTLKVYDRANNLIGHVGPLPLVKGECAVLFDLRSPTANIWRCDFSSMAGTANASPVYIDDLSFEGGSPPPVPTSKPVVTIANPVAGSMLTASNSALSGSVQGDGLVGDLQVTVDHRRMSWDQAPPDAYAVGLSGAGATKAFLQSIRLPLGLVTVTASAENTGGLQGNASVTFTNLPPQLQSTSLGNLVGVLDGSPSCVIAVYAGGALALSGESVFTIGTRMLAKWTSWIDAARSVSSSSFCPTENVQSVSSSALRQNFIGGRIYDDNTNVFFVSSTFSQAIDLLGGEALVGVPVADPVTAPAAHTWQFQRFARQQGGLRTTIEIKGDPPVLYVERQGGDLTVLTAAGLSLTGSTATLVDKFGCTDIQGPCAITAPVKTMPQVAGSRYCSGWTFPAVPEWVSILPNGHLVPTPAMGWVTDSGPSNEDFGLTHEFVFEHSNGTIWSDWTLFLHPLPAYNNLLASNTKMEVEIEYYPEQYLFTAYDGEPIDGDLYFVAGRWIIDCGHSDFSSEIHPPFVTTRIRTQGSGDSAQTSALMWVNGYYYSGQQVEVTIYPPPRPTPISFLTISVPDPAQAAYDVKVSGVFDPGATDPDFAAWTTATFSASAKPVSLAYGGRLPFSSGRTYAGTWTIGWENESQYQVQSLGAVWWP